MRYGLLVAAVLAGCLDAPEGGGDDAPADARDGDATTADCACPVEPCTFRFARSLRIAPSLVEEELSQVPVLVRVETGAEMAEDGSDLRFTTTGGTLLPHEIDAFPPAGGTAAIWVGLPAIAVGSETAFCLFYGADEPGGSADPSGVWDSGFAAVWHLGESASGALGEFADSSSQGCNGRGGDTATDDSLPERVAGQIGDAQEFDGDALVSFGSPKHLDLTGTAITIEAWFQATSFPTEYLALASKDGFVAGYRLMVGQDGEVLFQLTNEARRAATGAGAVAPGTWHHVAATYDGTAMRILVDGREARVKPEDGPIDSTEAPLHLGISNGDYALVGTLDEVRISTVARSAAWLAVQRQSVIGDLVEVGHQQEL